MITVSFPELSEEWWKFSATAGDLSLGTMGHWSQEKEHILLVGCEAEVTGRLPLIDDEIVIPEELLERVEGALESIANRISVLEGIRRRISSPIPCVALIPDGDGETDWLESTGGIRSRRTALQGFRYRIAESNERLLDDRSDGVALLAEALAHDHPTGRFHELLRLFERAFCLSSSSLAEPLGRFLETAGHGFSVAEAREWVVGLRHPATHADRRDGFVLERGIRPILRRMQQAAFDVLFNKQDWRSPNTGRRDAWRIPCGTSSRDGKDIFITRGRAMTMKSQLIDDFGSYPLNLSAGVEKLLPDVFWTRTAERKPIDS